MEENENVEKYDLTIDDIYFDGVQVISMVDYPAIEENFIYMGKEYKFQEINQEKRLIIGPAMIPEKDIVRYNLFGEKYYINFSVDTISKINEKFMKELRLKNTNLQHSLNTNDVSIIESWIIEDTNLDKAKALGFDLPKGTWMITMKVDNDEVWKMIKSGELRGFSIEGFFSHILVENSKNDIDKLTEELSKINKNK